MRTYSIRQTDRQRYEIRRHIGNFSDHVADCWCQSDADYLVFILNQMTDEMHLAALKASVAKADERNERGEAA